MRLLIISLILLCAGIAAAQLPDSLYDAGKTAYDSGRYEEAITYFESFENVRQNYPPVLMYLSMLYSRTGQTDQAVEYLSKTMLVNADTTFLERMDFDPIREEEDFIEAGNRLFKMAKPVRHSEVAFSLRDNQIHPEALAYDPDRSRFFIGSIRLRSIYIYEAGRSYSFKTEAEDSLLAVTGLEVDREGGVLWVCSASLPQMKLPSGDGSYIHAYDIGSGDLLLKYHLPGDIMLGDLTIGVDGGAYLTNSNAPEIYRADLDTVKLWRQFPELNNLQGIAKGDSGLFISDYISGIYKVDSDGFFRVSHPDTVSVKGIDGLYYRNGNLVGIQNGVFPIRITQYVLNETGDHIEKSIFLDKNLPGLNEPVQGAWVGDWFYFIANSPWPFYDMNMNLPADTPQPEVWRTNLAR